MCGRHEEKAYTLKLTDRQVQDLMLVLDKWVVKNPDQSAMCNFCIDAYEQLGEQKMARDMGL